MMVGSCPDMYVLSYSEDSIRKRNDEIYGCLGEVVVFDEFLSFQECFDRPSRVVYRVVYISYRCCTHKAQRRVLSLPHQPLFTSLAMLLQIASQIGRTPGTQNLMLQCLIESGVVVVNAPLRSPLPSRRLCVFFASRDALFPPRSYTPLFSPSPFRTPS